MFNITNKTDTTAVLTFETIDFQTLRETHIRPSGYILRQNVYHSGMYAFRLGAMCTFQSSIWE